MTRALVDSVLWACGWGAQSMQSNHTRVSLWRCTSFEHAVCRWRAESWDAQAVRCDFRTGDCAWAAGQGHVLLPVAASDRWLCVAVNMHTARTRRFAIAAKRSGVRRELLTTPQGLQRNSSAYALPQYQTHTFHVRVRRPTVLLRWCPDTQPPITRRGDRRVHQHPSGRRTLL